jgi:hypothetical protein
MEVSMRRFACSILIAALLLVGVHFAYGPNFESSNAQIAYGPTFEPNGLRAV